MRYGKIFLVLSKNVLCKLNTELLLLLQAYPPYPGKELVSKIPSDYVHAQNYLDSIPNSNDLKIGTLTKAEWEAACKALFYNLSVSKILIEIYCFFSAVFAFHIPKAGQPVQRC